MKLPNFLKGFSIKSVAHHDQFYVDDEGKHVIFRTIRGKIVPIKTTAEEYSEWLLKQGVDVDPADQTQLRALEEELEVLERAGEAGGPALQQQYEKAFAQQKQQYAQMVQQMYQQAVEAQSKESGVPAERIRESRKKTFEEAKDRTVKRKDMPDRGWESFVESYVEKMIESAGFEKKSGQWYIMQAYDLMLRKAKDAAQKGIDPTTMDLDKMVEEELQTYSGLTRHADHYSQYKDNDTDYSVEANMFRAVKWLKENLAQENESSAFMKDAFDAIYSKMHEDFNPQAKEEFEKIPEAIRVPQEMIPKELPPQYGARESAALMGVYRNSKGSKLGAAHTVSLHTIARLYDSIPEDERVAAIAELSDSSRGVHAVHQSKYRSVYHDKEQFGIEVNVERELEEILRAATRGAEGTTREKIQAIKEISGKLGMIHGAHTLAAMGDNPSLIKYRNRWQDASLNAGKRKGDGPNIIDTLIDSDRLNAAKLTNATLKVPHTPANAPQSKPEIKIPDKIAKKPKEKAEKLNEPSFTKEGKAFVTEDGYKAIPGKGQWSITNPDGEEIGSVFIEPGNPGDALIKALREAEAVIEKYKTGGKEETVIAPSAMFGFSRQPLSNKDRANLDKISEVIKENGLSLKEKIPGGLYEVPGTGLSVGYRKKDGSLLFLGPDRKPVGSVEEALGMLTAEKPEEEASAPKVDLISLANEKGGFTYSVSEGKLHEPDSGFAVSKLSKEEGEQVVKTQEDLDAFQEKHKDLLAQPNTYLGVWKNDAGDLVADVSTTYESQEEANAESVKNGQDGFYDFSTGETIYTNAKEETSGPTREEAIKSTEEIAAREDLPSEIKEIASSGRFNVVSAGVDDRGMETFEYSLRGTEEWPTVAAKVNLPDGRVLEKKPERYNPEIADAIPVEDEYGVSYKYEVKPGWSKQLEFEDPNMMYRGMSWEEWEEAKRTGFIQSKGDMNIGEDQVGLTYYTDNVGEASSYASSFAPERYKATPEKPAIVIAVPKREGKSVGGTGRSEIGIEGQIPLSEVSRSWEGHPYYSASDGNMTVRQEWGGGKSTGSAFGLSSGVAWKEAEGSPSKESTVEETTQEEAPKENTTSYTPYSEDFVEDEQKSYQGLKSWKEKVDASISNFTNGEFNSLSEMKVPPSVLREVYVAGDRPEDGAFRAIMTHLTGSPYYSKDSTPEIKSKYPNMPLFYGYKPTDSSSEEISEEATVAEVETPVEETPQETAVEETKPTSTKLPIDFADKVKDQGQLESISNYASKAGLTVSQTAPGRRDFEVTSESGNRLTVAMNKKGELFMLKPGQKAEPFEEKEFIRHFNPDDAFETIQMDKSRKTEAVSDKRMVAKQEKPKKAVDFDRKKKGIPWDSDRYGEVGAKADGTPTQGFATWVLENLGYRPEGYGTVEDKDGKKKKDPNQPIYSQDMLNQVIKKYKGLAPKGVIQAGETMKSLGLSSDRNLLPGFFYRQKI